MEIIDVEKIMQEIRNEIKENGYKESDIHFANVPIRNCSVALDSEYNEEKYEAYINYLIENKINYYSTFSNRGIRGFIKRIIRKIIKPVVSPLVNKQQQINAETLKAINMLRLKIVEQEQQIEILKNSKK